MTTERLRAALAAARDALCELNQSEEDDGALLATIDAALKGTASPDRAPADEQDERAARVAAADAAIVSRLFLAAMRVLNMHAMPGGVYRDQTGAMAELRAACDAYRTAGDEPEPRDPSYSREDAHHLNERG
jgi:hypothetical protein